MQAWFIKSIVLAGSGCQLFPEIAHQPVVHNPFPQLSKVAVAPFFNLSTDPTVDERQFAEAYFNELQLVQGFEVVPVGVVERAIGANQLSLAIPPGYGLPWGTPEEEFIPAPLVLESEMALAREQLRTQTPLYQSQPVPLPPPSASPPDAAGDADAPGAQMSAEVKPKATTVATTAKTVQGGPCVSPNYPDARAFIPPPPQASACACLPTVEPVLRRTQTFNGNDAELTEALTSYAFFKDDGRAGGWAAYLQRSDDFIRFCCHLHIYEMLSARGGGGQTRVVWRWSSDRYMYR